MDFAHTKIQRSLRSNFSALLIVGLCGLLALLACSDLALASNGLAAKILNKIKADNQARAASQAATETEAKPQKDNGYIKLLRDEAGRAEKMQVAIVRFQRNGKGKKNRETVDLVSAVHVGDKAYYQAINKQFKTYDSVLYELIAPKGTKIPKGGTKSSHPVSIIQRTMTDVLDLSYQLEEIDYTLKTMVHADLTPEEFLKAMEKRNESTWTIMLRAMAQSSGKTKVSDAELLSALFDSNRAMKLKQLMAEQFADLENMTKTLSGSEGSSIIEDRNQAAIKVLIAQLKAKKHKLAIFYGAAHMPDFQERLEKLGFVRKKTTWITAWDMSK